ncbi:uncharacterized protein [Panulirus ornatus]|uniref:uncharacterized protein isoform X2 n=1 Tax=Panulirus ornatus TaxID=150431 RepID=UPI003A899D63
MVLTTPDTCLTAVTTTDTQHVEAPGLQLPGIAHISQLTTPVLPAQQTTETHPVEKDISSPLRGNGRKESVFESSVMEIEQNIVTCKKGNMAVVDGRGSIPCQNPYPCCYVSLCLYGQRGTLTTILGERYILLLLEGAYVPVCINLDVSEDQISTCRVLWQGEKAVPLSQVLDGTQVEFDAICFPSTNTLVALIIWQDTKPTVCVQPAGKESYIMISGHGFTCNLNAVDEATESVIVNFDDHTVYAEISRDVVFMNGRKSNIWELRRHGMGPVFATVFQLLKGDVAGSVTYVCTCLWTGQMPEMRELPMLLQHRQEYVKKSHGLYVKANETFMLFCDIDSALTVSEKGYKLTFKVAGVKKSLLITRDQLYTEEKGEVPSITSEMHLKSHISRRNKDGRILWAVQMAKLPSSSCSSEDTGSQANAQMNTTLDYRHLETGKEDIHEGLVSPGLKGPQNEYSKEVGHASQSESATDTTSRSPTGQVRRMTSNIGSRTDEGGLKTGKTCSSSDHVRLETIINCNSIASQPKLENLTCSVAEAGTDIAVLSATGKFIIVTKVNFFINAEKVLASVSLQTELKRFPNVDAVSYEINDPIKILGYVIKHAAVVAWAGRKPTNIDEIVKAWDCKSFQTSGNKNEIVCPKTLIDSSSQSDKVFEASGWLVVDVFYDTGILLLCSKHIKGGIGGAIVCLSCIYKDGYPVDRSQLKSIPTGQMWHCLVQKRPPHELKDGDLKYRVNLAWQGQRPLSYCYSALKDGETKLHQSSTDDTLSSHMKSFSCSTSSLTGHLTPITSSTSSLTDQGRPKTSSTSSLTDQGRPKTSSTSNLTDYLTPKTSSTSSLTDQGRPKTSSTSSLTDQGRPKTSSTSSLTDYMTPKTSSTSSLTDYLTPKTSSTSSLTDQGRPEISSTSSLTDQGRPEISSTSSLTDQGRPKISSTSSLTDQVRPKTSSTSSLTDQGRPKTSSTSSLTDQVRPKTSGTSSLTDQVRPKTSGTSSQTDQGRPEISSTSSLTDQGRPEISSTSSLTDQGRPKISSTSSLTDQVRPKTSGTSSLTDQGRPETSSTSSLTDQVRPKTSSPSSLTVKGRPETSNTRCLTDHLGSVCSSAKSVSDQTNSDSTRNNSFMHQTPLQTNMDRKSGVFWPKLEYLTCSVAEAGTDIVILSAASKFILVSRNDLFIDRKKIKDSANLKNELERFPNVGAMLYETKYPMEKRGYVVNHAALVAWAGKKSPAVDDIVEAWESQTFETSSNRNEASSSKLQNDSLYLNDDRFQAGGVLKNVHPATCTLLLSSKHIEGGKGEATVQVSCMYKDGLPVDKKELKSTSIGCMWHCWAQKCPPHKVKNGEPKYRVILAWQGKKPSASCDPSLDRKTQLRQCNSDCSVSSHMQVLSTSTSSLTGQRRPQTGSTSSLTGQRRPQTSSTSSLTDQVRPKTSSTNSLTVKGRPETSNTRCLTDHLGSVCSSAKSVSDQTNSDSTRNNSFMHQTPLQTNMDRKSGVFWPKLEYLTCSVAEAGTDIVILSAASKFILVSRNDLFIDRKKIKDSANLKNELERFPNVGAVLYETKYPMEKRGYVVNHAALVAWAGKKSPAVDDIVEAWKSQTFETSSNRNEASSSKLQNDSLYLNDDRFQAGGVLKNVHPATCTLLLSSKHIEGGKGEATVQVSCMYKDGLPVDKKELKSTSIGCMWHCWAQKCPPHKVKNGEPKYRVILAWQGKKPSASCDPSLDRKTQLRQCNSDCSVSSHMQVLSTSTSSLTGQRRPQTGSTSSLTGQRRPQTSSTSSLTDQVRPKTSSTNSLTVKGRPETSNTRCLTDHLGSVCSSAKSVSDQTNSDSTRNNSFMHQTPLQTNMDRKSGVFWPKLEYLTCSVAEAGTDIVILSAASKFILVSRNDLFIDRKKIKDSANLKNELERFPNVGAMLYETKYPMEKRGYVVNHAALVAWAGKKSPAVDDIVEAWESQTFETSSNRNEASSSKLQNDSLYLNDDRFQAGGVLKNVHPATCTLLLSSKHIEGGKGEATVQVSCMYKDGLPVDKKELKSTSIGCMWHCWAQKCPPHKVKNGEPKYRVILAWQGKKPSASCDPSLDRKTQLRQCNSDCSVSSHMQVLSTSTSSLTGQRRPQTGSTSSLTGQRRPQTSSTSSLTDQVRPKTSSTNSLTVKGRPETSNTRCLTDHLGSVCSSAKSVSDQTNSDSTRNNSFMHQTPLQTNMDRKSGAFWPKLEYLTCSVAEAGTDIVILSAASKFILVSRNDLFIDRKKIKDSANLKNELERFPNVGAMLYETKYPMEKRGYVVNHAALVAWAGKKSPAVDDIVEAWESQTFETSSNRNEASSSKLQNDSLYLNDDRFQAGGVLKNVHPATCTLLLSSKHIEGGKGEATVQVSCMYKDGLPVDKKKLKSTSIGCMWHCWAQKCPPHKVKNGEPKYRVILAWQGKKPSASCDPSLDRKTQLRQCNSDCSVSSHMQVLSTSTSSLTGQRRPETSSTSSLTGQRRPETSSTSSLTGQRRPQTSSTSSLTDQVRPQTGSTSSLTGQKRPQTGSTSSLAGQRRPQTSSTCSLSDQVRPETSSTSNLTDQRRPKTSSTSNLTDYLRPKTSSTSSLTGQWRPQTGSTSSSTGQRRPQTSSTSSLTDQVRPQTGSTSSLTGQWRPQTGSTSSFTGQWRPQTGSTSSLTGQWRPQTGSTSSFTGQWRPQTGSTSSLTGQWRPQTGSTSSLTGQWRPQTGSTSSFTGQWRPQTGSTSSFTGQWRPQTGSTSSLTGQWRPQTGSTSSFTGQWRPQTGSTSSFTGQWRPQTGSTSSLTGQWRPQTGSTSSFTGQWRPQTGSTSSFTGQWRPQTGSTSSSTGEWRPQTGSTSSSTGQWRPQTGSTSSLTGQGRPQTSSTCNLGGHCELLTTKEEMKCREKTKTAGASTPTAKTASKRKCDAFPKVWKLNWN